MKIAVGVAETSPHLVYDSTSKTLTGNDQISIRYEPTGNPFVTDMRVSLKANSQDVERVITVGVPGGKSLLVYGSGVSPDGKPWWDLSYFHQSTLITNKTTRPGNLPGALRILSSAIVAATSASACQRFWPGLRSSPRG